VGRRLSSLCLVVAIVSTGCGAHHRASLLAFGGVMVGTGAVIASSAPSCPMQPEPEPGSDGLFDLSGVGCAVGRGMALSFGVTFIAAGVLSLVLAAHAGPTPPERPVAEGRVEDRMLGRARAEARVGRCDRVRILADTLSAKHPDYHARMVVNDPILRPCLE
jgi:hypothetical protein